MLSLGSRNSVSLRSSRLVAICPWLGSPWFAVVRRDRGVRFRFRSSWRVIRWAVSGSGLPDPDGRAAVSAHPPTGSRDPAADPRRGSCQPVYRACPAAPGPDANSHTRLNNLHRGLFGRFATPGISEIPGPGPAPGPGSPPARAGGRWPCASLGRNHAGLVAHRDTSSGLVAHRGRMGLALGATGTLRHRSRITLLA